MKNLTALRLNKFKKQPTADLSGNESYEARDQKANKSLTTVGPTAAKVPSAKMGGVANSLSAIVGKKSPMATANIDGLEEDEEMKSIRSEVRDKKSQTETNKQKTRYLKRLMRD